jgi:ABC-type antimicrobial peptide transport system permease subunit
MRPWILGARVFAALSALALIVAMIGVYAMAAFEARQRTREIGVRIALGAQATDVVSLLVRQGSRVVAIGVLLGGAAAIAAGRFVESVLFGVSSRDPLSILGASAVLLGVAAVASFVPSWRATRIDPVVVLRDE